MRIDLNNFSGGLNTYKGDDELALTEAQTAENCFVGDGALTPTPNLKVGDPSGIYEDIFNDDNNCGYVEYNGTEYNGCDLSGLGLPQPGAPTVSQGFTPEVIGPSEDGSGNFNSFGDWEQNEYIQRNVWTAPDIVLVVDFDFEYSQTITDSWVVCDTPDFNITEYYSLLRANPTLKKTAPTKNEFGCITGSTGSEFQTGPGDSFTSKYFTENTSYAISYYNEDWDIESTVSNITEFELTPVVTHKRWTYGPLQGDTEGKTWYPPGTVPESTTLNTITSDDPTDLRGNITATIRYTGISRLHQVQVKLPSHPNASHTILYRRIGGSLRAIAMLRGGGTVTVRPDGVFEGNGGTDLSLDSQLANRRPVFTEFKGPPASLNGIAINSIGIMVGFDGDTIHISEPDSGFHLWNPDARFTLSYTPLTVHSIYNEFFITTTGKPVKITGSNPATMIPLELPDLEYNVARKSAVDAGRQVMWAGPNGVSMYDGSQVRAVTRNKLSKADWLEIISEPDDLVGVASEEVYILFYTSGALIVDMRPESASVTKWDVTATKAVYDVEEGWIYISGGRKFRMHESLSKTNADKEGTWETGRIYIGSVNETLSWMRVFASGYAEISLINDENEETTFTVSEPVPFRIGINGQAIRGEWIKMTAKFKNRVKAIQMASSLEELQR